MIRINILSCSQAPFFPHWNKDKFPESDFQICENSSEDIEWDCVIVYQNIKCERTIKCKQGNLVYICGEPPLMFPSCSPFLKQFDFIILPNKNIKYKNKLQHHGFLNWSLGYGFFSKKHKYNYKDIAELNPVKTKNISIVSSTQKMMPGHNLRMAIIEQLIKDYPNDIDIYGRGFKPIDYKADALLEYRFHICIENSYIEDYWTEKIADPILALSVPIYSGCTNINKYLGTNGYYQFDIKDYNSLKKIIDKILASPEAEYQQKLSYLKELRTTIMEKENLIPFIINWLNSKTTSYTTKQYTIKPFQSFKVYHIKLLLLRFRRLCTKLYLKAILK